MKVCMFHLMPYRELPADFEQRYKSAYIDPLWFDVADRRKGRRILQCDARRAAVCREGRHARRFAPTSITRTSTASWPIRAHGPVLASRPTARTSPSSSSARRCRRPRRHPHRRGIRDARLHQRRRLVAGFPTGLPTDATISNAVVPLEQRERYREALALVIKAWSAKEMFAWNGKHYQLGMVNLWPRPIQQPHPPIWIPGSGISSRPNMSSVTIIVSVT